MRIIIESKRQTQIRIDFASYNRYLDNNPPTYCLVPPSLV